jgi:hypothetical protein
MRKACGTAMDDAFNLPRLHFLISNSTEEKKNNCIQFQVDRHQVSFSLGSVSHYHLTAGQNFAIFLTNGQVLPSG